MDNDQLLKVLWRLSVSGITRSKRIQTLGRGDECAYFNPSEEEHFEDVSYDK